MLIIAVFRDDWPHLSSVFQTVFLPLIRSVRVPDVFCLMVRIFYK